MVLGTKRAGKFCLVFCLLLLSLLFSGCRNKGKQTFVQKHRVRDSLIVVDIQFYSRLSYKFKDKNLPTEVVIVAPSGLSYIDTVIFPAYTPFEGIQKSQIQKEGMWKDVVSEYRCSVRFPEKGVWEFRFTSLFEDKNKASWVKEMGVVVLPSDISNKGIKSKVVNEIKDIGSTEDIDSMNISNIDNKGNGKR